MRSFLLLSGQNARIHRGVAAPTKKAVRVALRLFPCRSPDPGAKLLLLSGQNAAFAVGSRLPQEKRCGRRFGALALWHFCGSPALGARLCFSIDRRAIRRGTNMSTRALGSPDRSSDHRYCGVLWADNRSLPSGARSKDGANGNAARPGCVSGG